MLSNLPKLLDRNFVLGFVLPVLLFAVAALLLLRDYAFASVWLESLLAKDITSAAYAVAIVWLLAVVLLLFNHAIYRIFEGYVPPLSWRRGAIRRIWQQIQQWQADANDLRERYNDLTPAEFARYTDLREALSQMPGTEGDVLPTRFGNAIRAFENYASDVYGADGVTIWPRLLPVASNDYAAAVQDARTQVDFHLGCCVLSMGLAVLALVVVLQQTPFSVIGNEASYAWELSWHAPIPDGATSRGLFMIWWPLLALLPFGKLLWFVAACFAAWFFYLLAVWAVPAWGDLVMAGFDCYLPKLAEQLGFTLPRNDARRRLFWEELSAMMAYRTLPGEPPLFQLEDWLFPPRH
jgi:hypothetical protein